MTGRFDRTLRTVMWLDAFLSAALAAVCFVAAPVIATVGVPAPLLRAVCVAAVGLAVLLAALGAITFIVITRRMRAGEYLLPARLQLPLPAMMRPDLDGNRRDFRGGWRR